MLAVGVGAGGGGGGGVCETTAFFMASRKNDHGNQADCTSKLFNFECFIASLLSSLYNVESRTNHRSFLTAIQRGRLWESSGSALAIRDGDRTVPECGRLWMRRSA